MLAGLWARRPSWGFLFQERAGDEKAPPKRGKFLLSTRRRAPDALRQSSAAGASGATLSSGVSFIAGDGPNDVVPTGLPASVPNPLHRLALVAMGVNIFDNLDFERAVEQARRLNRFEFLFTAAPLRIEKGTGSPLNPLAIF